MIEAALAFGAIALAAALLVALAAGIIWLFALPVRLHLDRR